MAQSSIQDFGQSSIVAVGSCFPSIQTEFSNSDTVKPVNLAALKVGDFDAKLSWPLLFWRIKTHTVRNTVVISSYFGLQLIFAPFNFAVLFGSLNKGSANIKGFTVDSLLYGAQFR